MRYNREAIKQFIRDYSKENRNTIYDENTNVDDFFSLNDEVEQFELNENTGNQVFFNELDQLIYAVGTRREYYIFFLLCEGKSLNEVDKILNLRRERIRQLFNGLLDNAYQSAVNAGYSVSYARGNAIKLLENVSINQYIDDNLEIIQKESIAETDEIMRYLTRVLRGEEKEEILVYVGDGMQEIQTIRPSAKDRIKAAELLGKRYRMWTDKHEVEITTPIFIDDVPEED